jgi:hypothetical protein
MQEKSNKGMQHPPHGSFIQKGSVLKIKTIGLGAL